MAAALEVEGLSVRFGGVRALDGASLRAAPGEALGLLGPNGSGKTTLLDALSGHHVPEAGAIRLGGADIAGQPPHRIARRGVARSFQSLRLLRRLSVYENLRAATHAAAPRHEALWQGRAARARERARLMALLDAFGLARRADDLPEALTLAQMRRLEIARLLAARPRLVLLDEPAAGLTGPETDTLAQALSEHVLPGRTVILVEHKLSLVRALCPRAVVLAAGRVLAEGPTDRVLDASEVRARYFGRAA